MEPIDAALLKNLNECFAQVKTLLGKSEDALKFPHEAIWKNDTQEYLKKAQDKFRELIDSKPEFEIIKAQVKEQYDTRVNSILSGYNIKLYTVEADKIVSQINDNLNKSNSSLTSNSENIWKNDTMEYLQNAKKLYDPFAGETKYIGVRTRDTLVSNFETKYNEVLLKYNTKIHSKTLEKEVSEVKNNIDKADNALKQPHENQYKKDSMEYFGIAKAAFQKMEENPNYVGIREREDLVVKFPQRVSDFLAAYSAKIYAKEFETVSYQVKSNLDSAERAVDQPQENIYKNDTMEYLGKARKALEDLESLDHLKSLRDYDTFINKTNDRIKALMVKYTQKVYTKELEALIYPITGNMDKAENALKQPHENQYKKDSMEYLSLCKSAMNTLEQNENLKDFPKRNETLTKVAVRIEKFLEDYSLKVYTKEYEAKLYKVNDNIDRAFRALEQPHENQYKNDSMEYFSIFRTEFEELKSNDNFLSVKGRDDAIEKLRPKTVKFLEDYSKKVYSKEMEKIMYHITNNYDQAIRALEQPQENLYRDDSMEYYGRCQSYLKELSDNTNFINLPGRDDIIVKYTIKLAEFLPSYSTKVYSKEMEKEIYAIKDNMDKAERAIDQPQENIYRDDSMEYFSKAKDLISSFQDETKYVGLKGRDEIIANINNRIPTFLDNYSTKVYTKEMEKDVFSLKNNMDKAERAIDQPQENIYRDDSMEYLGLVKEALREFEGKSNFIGLKGRNELIENLRERIPKFMTRYSEKVFSKEMEKETYSITGDLDRAFRALEDPNEAIYAQDSMEYFGRAKEVFKSFSSNSSYIGLEGRDKVLISFAEKSDKFLSAYKDKVTIKEFEKVSYLVISNLDKMENALKSHIPDIYKNDSMEYFGKAKSEFKSLEENTTFADLPQRAELVKKYDARTSQFLFDYNNKIFAKEFEKATYPIKQLLSSGEETFKKGPPKQWWTEGLEKVVQAKVLLQEFQEKDEFKSMQERDDLINNFKTRYESFMTQYTEKVFLDDVKSQITSLNSLISDAEATFKKGPPKQWWTDSLEKIVKAKAKFNEFEEKSEYKGISEREQFVESFSNRVLAYQTEYNTKVLAFELDESIRTLRSAYNTAKDTFNRGNNKSSWVSGFEQLIKARDQFNGFKDNNSYKGIKQRDDFVVEFEELIEKFKNEYREKVFIADIKEAIDPIKSKISDAESTFAKGPPKQWWVESLAKIVDAKQLFREFEGNDEYVGVQIREDFVNDFRNRTEKFIEQYNTKVLAQEVVEAISTLKSAFSAAENTFAKGSKSFWDQGLEQMVRAQLEFDDFLHKTEFIGIGDRDKFIVEAKARIEKFKVSYNQVIFNDDLKYQISEIKSLLTQAKSDFQRGPPKVWWTQALEKIVKAKQLFKDFEEKAEFKGIEAREQFAKEFEGELTTFTTQYNEKVLVDEIKSQIQEINSKVNEAESTFRNANCRQFLDDSFKLLLSVRPSFLEFEAKTEYKGVAGSDEFIKITNERIKKLEGDYNEKVFLDELKVEIDSLNSQFNNAQRIFQQGPPKSFWDEAYLKLSTTLENFNRFKENSKFHSIKTREEFVEQFSKKIEKFDLEYKEKALGDEIKQAVLAIKTKVDNAESLYKKGGFREYWDDALLRFVEVKKIFLEFEKNKLYNGVAIADELKTSFQEKLSTFEKLYQEKYGFEAETLKSVSVEVSTSTSASVQDASTPKDNSPPVNVIKDGRQILRTPVFAVGTDKIVPLIAVGMSTPPALIGLSGSFNGFVKKIGTVINEINNQTNFNAKELAQLSILEPNGGYKDNLLEGVFRDHYLDKSDTLIELKKQVEGLKKSINDIKNSNAKDLEFSQTIYKSFDLLVNAIDDAKKQLKLRYELIDDILQVSYRLTWCERMRKEPGGNGSITRWVLHKDHHKGTVTFVSFDYNHRYDMKGTLTFKPVESSKILNEKITFLKQQLKDCKEKYDGFFEFDRANNQLDQLNSQALASLIRQSKLNAITAPTGADANYLKSIEASIVHDLKQVDIGLNSGLPFKGTSKNEKWDESENKNFYGKAIFDVYDPPQLLTKRDVDRNNRTQFIHGADNIYVRFYIPEPLNRFPIAVWNTGKDKGKPFYPVKEIAKYRGNADPHNPRVQVNILINGKVLENKKDSSNGFYSEDCWGIYNTDRTFGLPIFTKRTPKDKLSKVFYNAIEEAGVGVHKVEVQFRFGYFNTKFNKKNAFDMVQPDFDIDYTSIASSVFEITKVANPNDLIEKITLGPEAITKLPYQETIIDQTWDACNKPHVGKIVFAKDKIAPMLARSETAKFKDEFKFGTDSIYARFVIPSNLRDYPLGIYKDGPFKGKPFYAKNELKRDSETETHKILVSIGASINGKKIVRNQVDGNTLYTFFADKLYSTQRTFGFNLLHNKGVAHTLSDKKLLAGFFASHLLAQGAGKHKVELEARFKVVQKELNKTTPQFDYPNFDLDWSEPIAVGQISIQVDAGAKLYDFLPVTNSKREEVQFLLAYFQKDAKYGGHQPPKENLALDIVGEWEPKEWRTPTKVTVVYAQHSWQSDYEIVEKLPKVPTAYGLDIVLYLYHNSENGFADDVVERIELQVCNKTPSPGYNGTIGNIKNVKSSTFSPNILDIEALKSRLGYKPANKSKNN